MDHVEECPSFYVDCYGTICDCDYEHICMCRELRACEKRVRREEIDRPDTHSTYVYRAGRAEGYEKGLNAAREAVLGARSLDVASGHMVDGQARFVWMNHALEAIDALRKDGNE